MAGVMLWKNSSGILYFYKLEEKESANVTPCVSCFGVFFFFLLFQEEQATQAMLFIATII